VKTIIKAKIKKSDCPFFVCFGDKTRFFCLARFRLQKSWSILAIFLCLFFSWIRFQLKVQRKFSEFTMEKTRTDTFFSLQSSKKTTVSAFFNDFVIFLKLSAVAARWFLTIWCWRPRIVWLQTKIVFTKIWIWKKRRFGSRLQKFKFFGNIWKILKNFFFKYLNIIFFLNN